MGLLLRLLYLVCISAVAVICLSLYLWKAVDSPGLGLVSHDVEHEKNFLARIIYDERQREVINPTALTHPTLAPTYMSEQTYASKLNDEKQGETEPPVLSQRRTLDPRYISKPTYASKSNDEQPSETEPPVLSHRRTLDPRYNSKQTYANKSNDKQPSETRPPVVLTRLRHLPSQNPRSKKYAINVDNLEKCLDTSNLTEYFMKEKFLMQALANVRYYVDTLRRFIPYNFERALPNHCWEAGVELDISRFLVSGHFNGIKFSVSRAYLEKFTPRLNTLPNYGNTTGDSSNHSMPFSCIPEVFLAGFYKCGSTYLYSLINSHPAFSYALAHRKEPDWFIRDRHFINEKEKRTAYFADYIANFESLVNHLSITAKVSHGIIQYPLGLDGSAGMLLFWPTFFQQQRIVNFCLLPSVIPEILPKAKFIVVMREPSSMLYSLFWFSCTRRHQPVPSLESQLNGPDIFHKRVMDGISAIKSCLTAFPLVKCLIDSANRPDTFHPLMPKYGEVNFSIYVALYYVHVQKWLSVVPRERFLFLTLEELSRNIYQTANQIWSFLKVQYTPLDRVKSHAANEQMAVDYKHDPRLAMRNDTREILKSFFSPYNRMLADLLGDEKFLWK